MIAKMSIQGVLKWAERLGREKRPKPKKRGIPFYVMGAWQGKRKCPSTLMCKVNKAGSSAVTVEGRDKRLEQVDENIAEELNTW